MKLYSRDSANANRFTTYEVTKVAKVFIVAMGTMVTPCVYIDRSCSVAVNCYINISTIPLCEARDNRFASE